MELTSAEIILWFGEHPEFVVLLVLSVIALLRSILLSRRITLLTRGGDGKSLEKTIRALEARAEALEAHAHTTETALNNLDERLKSTVRGIALTRYDSFSAGGQQSFSAALVSEDGSGVVLSGIHARDSVRVYAKDIGAFKSDRELSAEESIALTEARKKL